MVRSARRRMARQEGQSLIEMAMVLPLLLGVVVGILEFGRAWNVRQVTTHAAREAARLAILESSDEGQVRAAVEAQLSRAGLDPEQAEIQISGVDGDVGDLVDIQVVQPFTFQYLGPLLGLLTAGEDDEGEPPGTIEIEAQIVMRHE